MTVVTPMNKNIHEITALEDTAFIDIIVPDYTDDNTCNYFQVINKDNKTFMKRTNYI